ncbi:MULTISPECIES: O-methyltransferase [Anaerostipes]|uniref:O-methyltransferase n=1 Tax=Anaerostipes TaxID=207244 RepID=UPI00259010A1|nr:O-methyltransferase [Anaerostipes sp.]MCI5623062.1 O-methyltransferase [Anaerostipes sp.]MDY2726440.1 O-methyltransferase [Anaerostipes faecalis]
MIVDQNITDYIRSLMKEEKNLLGEIEYEARQNHVPIVKPETKELLRMLVRLKQPMKILEVGAAVGFSSLYMNKYQPTGGNIITIERNEKRIKKAKENIHKMGKEEQITLLEGDAIEILKSLDGSYDFIFVDAAKGQYIHFLDDVLRLLSPKGLLVSDNVLQDGDVAKSRYAIERRDRTIHKRMRDFLYTIKNHPQLETTILPVGDGVAISMKTGETNERD